jgi:anti-sigma factor RsiW
VTHLGQRLSALIDGELDGTERERVLVHMTGCCSCRNEVAALRMLKRRMRALDEDVSGVGADLTGRLMGLSALASLPEHEDATPQTAPDPWPSRPADRPDPWPSRPGGGGAGHAPGSPEQRAGRYFIAGSLAIFLAGLGTAAVIAGGESQPQAPMAPVTPSVDVMVFSSQSRGSGATADQPGGDPVSARSRPAAVPSLTVRSGS